MYIPSANRVEDPAVIEAFMAAHGFATVVTVVAGTPFASHVPVEFDPESRCLWGHLARANEQWRHFDGKTEVLCIFHGPHAYISPSWYASRVAVPTWNYAVVHAYGVAEVQEDPDTIRSIVERLTRNYEAGRENPWELAEMGASLQGLFKAIVGFRIRVTRLEAKFKLGQNRSAEDRSRLLSALQASGDSDAKALAVLMEHPPSYRSGNGGVASGKR